MPGISPRIAVLGAGAVGCYFGGMLARAGRAVTLIGRAPHMEAIRREGLLLDGIHFQGRISISASTDVADAQGAGVLLLCVKTLDTVDAMKAVLPYLAPGTIVASLQNGVDNVDRIREALGVEAVPVVVYVAAEMTGSGRLKHNGRGDLVVPDTAAGTALASLFGEAGVPCRVSPHIAGELWTKMIMNCVFNALSALARTRYGALVEDAGAREMMRQVIEEAVAVAGALGVPLSAPELMMAALKLGKAMAGALSSTGQDILRGKRTEIDSLNGYVVRRGADLGVPAPVNETLHALVKLREESA